MNPAHLRWGTRSENASELVYIKAFYQQLDALAPECREEFKDRAHPARVALRIQGFLRIPAL